MSRGVPPLLLLAEGRRARPRKAPADRPKEVALHRAVVAVLRKVGGPTWRWTHPASGEKRDPATAAKLKALGVRRGWPDLLLLSPAGALHCLEFKAFNGELSEDQEDFRLFCIRSGIRYAVIRTIDEALATLAGWGAIRKGQQLVKVEGAETPSTNAIGEGVVQTTPSAEESVKDAETPLISSADADKLLSVSDLPPYGEVCE